MSDNVKLNQLHATKIKTVNKSFFKQNSNDYHQIIGQASDSQQQFVLSQKLLSEAEIKFDQKSLSSF